MRINIRIASLATGVAVLGALGAFAAVASAQTAPTTNAATNISASDATLNGTNGGSAASSSSFWVSTSTFSTASTTLPSGVYSTADLGPQNANAPFSATLSSAMGLPAITPNTTYYFAAWTGVASTTGAATTTVWSPGTVLHFTTASSSAATSSKPVISDVSATATGTSTATITWKTDVPASSQVEYGTSTPYTASSTLAMASSTSHSVSLTNLSEATLYHFAVMSGNTAGTSTSADNEFVTQSTASTTPLAIDKITTDQSSGVADNTFTDGWQWTIHFTVPDNENAFRIRFSDWGNASKSFATANNVQIYSPQSSNASSTSSAVTESSNGYGGWLYLNGDTGTTTPGRQIDLVVRVKIPFGTSNGSYSSNFTAQSYPSTATSTAI